MSIKASVLWQESYSLFWFLNIAVYVAEVRGAATLSLRNYNCIDVWDALERFLKFLH